MITLFQSDTVYTFSQMKNIMAAQIRRLPAQVLPIGEQREILRFEWACAPVNVLAWLHNQSAPVKVYWSGRGGAYEMGGIGSADVLTGPHIPKYKDLFTDIQSRLSPGNPRLRFYGGMGFQGDVDCDEWRTFGAYRFTVPQFECVQDKGRGLFAFNVSLANFNGACLKGALDMLDGIDFSDKTVYRKAPVVLSRQDFPGYKQWEEMFNGLTNRDGSMKLDKIVMARKSTYDFDVPIRPDALIKHLKEDTPRCFHFCFQPCADKAFLGASPELLYRRTHRAIDTEAIAGTRPRGRDAEEDGDLADGLYRSEKDAREHRFVTRAIHEALKPLCSDVSSGQAFDLCKLNNSQHLITPFQGTLLDNVDDARLLAALHPTPAVAGWPTYEAIKRIREIEPFDRGWYAGPVGYVGFDQAELAVAIRSALVQENQLSLYAGAGIVAGSTPRQEWDEIENKISNFIKVFEMGSATGYLQGIGP